MVELLLASFVFTVIAGAVFSILLSSQIRYQNESGLTSVFQQANIVMDQITRDIHAAGYPPKSSFTSDTITAYPNYFAVAFPWSPSYPATPCAVGATCTSPSDYDLSLEVDLRDTKNVQWIRYTLDGTTLKRGMAQKVQGSDPVSAIPLDSMSPYLENVMNNPSSDQMQEIQARHPGMFPGGQAVPVFSYDTVNGAPVNQPSDIHEVTIRLIVMSNRLDPQTGKILVNQSGEVRLLTVTGQAVQFNPNQ